MAKKSKQYWYHPNQLLNPFAEGKSWWGRKGMDVASYLSMVPGLFKEGGSVKPKGTGKATHGFGRAMRKK